MWRNWSGTSYYRWSGNAFLDKRAKNKDKRHDMHNFRKLAIWIKSMTLVTEIYQLTNTFPSHERFGLMSQMQRAAVSIPTNIAEGSAKTSN